MPMFDDPNKELRRLENELLAEEEDDTLDGVEELLENYEEEGFDDCFQEEAEEDDAFSRPLTHQVIGNDYNRAMSEALLEMEEDADRTLYEEDYRKAKKKKNKSVVGLAILCVLETAAIVGLLAWWYLCLR